MVLSAEEKAFGSRRQGLTVVYIQGADVGEAHAVGGRRLKFSVPRRRAEGVYPIAIALEGEAYTK